MVHVEAYGWSARFFEPMFFYLVMYSGEIMQLGCHISIADGFTKAGETAVSIGAKTFQFFIRNPRGARSSAILSEDVAGLVACMEQHAFAPLLAHAAYTLNPCSSKPETRAFAKQAMQEDIDKLTQLPCHLYNFHPGNHTGQGVAIGIEQTIECMNSIQLPNEEIVLVIEAMAGCGTEIGSQFEEIASLINGFENKKQVGVCLDTCHIFAAGYDIKDNPEKVLDEFDAIIGLSYLRAIHLNDSMHGLGSKKDRHANIGDGEIGLDALVRFICLEPVRNLPMFLETKNDSLGHAKELALLNEACGQYLKSV